jgi:hypothetical protein
MFRHIKFLLIIIFMIPNTGSVVEASTIIALSKKRYFNMDKESIGGFKLRMSENEVIKKLGTPKSRKKYYDNACSDSYISTIEYSDLWLEFIQDSKTGKYYMLSISTTSSRYPVNTGIRVGDSMEKARKTYATGAFNVSGINSPKSNIFHFSDPVDSSIGIHFSGQKGIIKIITISANIC